MTLAKEFNRAERRCFAQGELISGAAVIMTGETFSTHIHVVVVVVVVVVVEVLLYVYRKRRLIRDGSPGRPPRLSYSS